VIIVPIVVGLVVILLIVGAAVVVKRRRDRAHKSVKPSLTQEKDSSAVKPDTPQQTPKKQSGTWTDSAPTVVPVVGDKDKHIEDNAATKIQSVWRGHNDRKNTKNLKIKESPKKEEKAAVKLPPIGTPVNDLEEEKKQREAEILVEQEKRRVEAEEKAKEERKKRIAKKKKEKEDKNKELESRMSKLSPSEQESQQKAAAKIQRTYRKYLQRSDFKREKEIEQLLFDIDELLALEM
jgi:hypothetical protein